MRKMITAVGLCAALTSVAALADDYRLDTNNNYNNNQAGMAATDDASGNTSMNRSDVEGGYLRGEKVGIRPQVGAVFFHNAANPGSGLSGTDSRAAAGLTIDANMTSLLINGPTSWYIGPSTGALYSHIGQQDSNFIGTNSAAGLDSGFGTGSFLMIPANLKAGYAFNDFLRLSGHGGGNVIYRSNISNVALSNTDSNNWGLFPNAGLDLDIGLGKRAGITLRPDVTFATGSNLYTGTVGFALALG